MIHFVPSPVLVAETSDGHDIIDGTITYFEVSRDAALYVQANAPKRFFMYNIQKNRFDTKWPANALPGTCIVHMALIQYAANMMISSLRQDDKHELAHRLTTAEVIYE